MQELRIIPNMEHERITYESMELILRHVDISLIS